jgi:chaperonin GroEL
MLIDRSWGPPLVSDDGVTIAKQVDLADREENLGARLLREAAERTGDAVGDGTTTATLLAHALLVDGLRNVAAGASALELKRGLERGLAAAVSAIRDQSRPVGDRKEKAQVAALSAHGDPRIGEMVADALERVGPEGVVALEEAKGTETTLEVVEGMQFDRGYLSPYFVTAPDRRMAVLENPWILLVEKRISALPELLPLLEKVVQTGRPLLIVAEDVEGEALATLVVNKLRGMLPCVAVKAPGYGDRRKAVLEDVGVLTGGRVVSEELGVKLANVVPEDLGTARRVEVEREATTIIGGAGGAEAVRLRCEGIRKEIEASTSDYDKEQLRQRLAKLAGGVAVIRVGAPTEAEMKNRKEAFEDAVAATKAALAEGVVPGGGLALLRAVPAVEAAEAGVEGDLRTGVGVLRRALERPVRQIAENAGADPGAVVDRLLRGPAATGYDAAKGEYVDLVAAGIVDPTKVVRLALENATSAAGTLLLAGGAITEIEEKPARGGPTGDLDA